MHPPITMYTSIYGDLAFTRYCFTYIVVCARIDRPFILPARLHCPRCCNTFARLLGNIRPPPPTSLMYATHLTILVITISCKGQTVIGPRPVGVSFTSLARLPNIDLYFTLYLGLSRWRNSLRFSTRACGSWSRRWSWLTTLGLTSLLGAGGCFEIG